MWWTKKKSSDHALKELVNGLSGTLGAKLLSVLLYGSKASGEFREGRSNVNVFILLSDASPETLMLLEPAIKTWLQNGHATPVLIAQNELQRYADSLPVEFLDMVDHHRVLFGQDALQGLLVNRTNLRAQCALELSVKMLKLRQGYLLAKGNKDRLRQLVAGAVPGILTLYRAVLRLDTDVSAGSKLDAALALAKRVGMDATALERFAEVHTRRQTDDVDDVARQMLSGLEHVMAYLDQK